MPPLRSAAGSNGGVGLVRAGAACSRPLSALVVDDLHPLPAAVARVGEVNAAARIDGQVVGRVVAPALVAVGQHSQGAVRLGAGDAAAVRLAGQQPAPAVEEQSVGAGPVAV